MPHFRISPNLLNQPIKCFFELLGSCSCNRPIWNLRWIYKSRPILVPISFLMEGCGLEEHWRKVTWDDVTRPLEEGGLGIKKLVDWNYANIARYVWLLCQVNSNSSWVKWVRANLLHKSQFWVAKIPWDCTWTWRKILKLRDKMSHLIKYKIGDGSKVSLWYDFWLPTGPIHSEMGDRVIYDSGLGKEAKVCKIIINNRWRWPVTNSTDLLRLKRGMAAIDNPDCSKDDEAIWNPNGGNNFTVTSAWQVFRHHGPKVIWSHIVWFKKAIPRQCIILWLAIRERLATQDKLVRYGKIQGMSCVLCRDKIEDHNHLFFQCSFSQRIWTTLIAKCCYQCTSRDWQGIIQWASNHLKGNSLKKNLCKLVLSSSVYVIWRERNSRTFSNSYRDVNTVMNEILGLVRNRATSFKGVRLSTTNKHLQQIWGLPSQIF